MWAWIDSNKEWVFSGVGVPLVMLIIKIITKDTPNSITIYRLENKKVEQFSNIPDAEKEKSYFFRSTLACHIEVIEPKKILEDTTESEEFLAMMYGKHYEINSKELLEYKDEIDQKVKKSFSFFGSKFKYRGLIGYEGEAIKKKIKYINLSIDIIDDDLWLIHEIRTYSRLTNKEQEKVISIIEGQISDGWGEGFEQHPVCKIRHNNVDGFLYISPFKGIEDGFFEKFKYNKDCN